MEEAKFIVTTNLVKIAEMDKRIRIVQGGSSAGKTFSIIPLLINYAVENPEKYISVVSESTPHLKRGAMKDFEVIMRATGRWIEGAFNKQNLVYTFANDSKIEFFSADSPDKLRGARRDALFINEANNVNFEAYQQLAIRTNDFVFIDYNPVAEFWAHTELMDREDADFIILTYKGNEGLPQSIVHELELNEAKKDSSPYWKNWVEVYVYGRIGQLTGAIIQNWKKVDDVPEYARLMGYGMDFGFSNDPSALVGFYRADGQLFMKEEMYDKGLTNADINDLWRHKGISKVQPIFADSAEPKSIEELRRYGWNIKPTKKGKDSILYGIDILSSQDTIGVPASCTNFIKELRNYVWETDKDGHKMNRPIDKWNHLIDAARYFAMMKLRKRNDFFAI